MTPRARRWTWFLAVVVLLGAAAASGAWWVMYTQAGARWGFEQLGAILPGKLDVAEMRGPLRGPLEVRHFTYRTPDLEITIDRLQLDWRLQELLRRRLEIRRLYAEDVRVLRGAAGDTPRERDSLASPLPDVDLPVSIVVHDGVVNRMEITRPGLAVGTHVHRVELDATSRRRGDSLDIRRLVVRSRALDIDARGTALPRGAYPMVLYGRWAWRPLAGPALAGVGAVEGTLDTLRVVQRLSLPFRGRLDARFFRALGRDMRFDGDLEFDEVEPRLLGADLEGRFSGRLHARGNLRAYEAQGVAIGSAEALGPTHASFHVRRDPARWRIESLGLTLPQSDARLTARGTVTTARGASVWNLDTEWRNLDWPLRGTPWIESDRGSAHLEGTPANFAIRAEALVAGRDLPPGRWWLEGRGGQGRLAVHTVIADLLEGRVTGNGMVAWEPRVAWRLALAGRGFDPGAVWAQWPGNLSFDARTEGFLAGGKPEGRLLVSRVHGVLRQQPLEGAGTLTASRGRYRLENASAQWGGNRAEASGSFGQVWSLRWSVDAPALSAVLPRASGSLRASGALEGPRGALRARAEVSGDSLHLGRFHAGTLRGGGDLDLGPGGPVRVELAATDVDLGARGLQRALLEASGTRDRHQLRASLAGRRDSLAAQLAGGYRAGRWRGEVTQLDLVQAAAGRWTLAGPAGLEASRERVAISDLVWASGPSRILVGAEWRSRGPWRVDSDLRQVQLALFEPLLPPEMRLEGAVEGRIVARRTPAGAWLADMRLVPGPGRVLHLDPSGNWVPTAFENGIVRVEADGRRLEGVMGVDLVNVGTVRATFNLPAAAGLDATERPLQGRLAAHLSDLAIVQGLTPELDATAGRLDADLAFGGTLGRPVVRGDVLLEQGRAVVPRLGVEMSEVRLRARGASAGRMEIEGSLRSGPGRLTLRGDADLGERRTARLAIQGDRVQAMDTHDLSLVVSPDLRLTLEGKRLDLEGELTIPQAELELDDDDQRVVRTSNDVVYSGADTLGGAPVDVHARVRVVLGREVWVRGFGLDARATGSLLATDQPGLPTLGTGQLRIEEGRYRIYGQELAVDRGVLIFGGGPIANPGLDVRASRRANDGVVAGFLVRGTMQAPDVRVFSEPALGESQALAYILFGRPIEKANLSEGQLASTLATSLGVRGTSLLAHGLASGLGIENARIETGRGFENASLLLGTHLSPRLYLSYGVGLFETASALRLQYLISDRWSVEAETAEQNRVDILYTVER